MDAKTTNLSSNITIENLTRRTVRSWWADGLWDFAIAGYMILIGLWMYILVRVIAFPSWTWPWPFITREVENPMAAQILVWGLAIIPVSALYMWLTYKLVLVLKAKWLASRQGDVRHSFWLKVEPRFWGIYILGYLGAFAGAAGLILLLTGSPHFYSVMLIAAPASVLVTFGIGYSLRRYTLAGVIGFVGGLFVEALLTTQAVYLKGPNGFLDVSPDYGNPAIPALIWAAIFLVSGIIGLMGVLSLPEQEAV